ncbi:uracil-DNA glycosylase [Candidatus Berkiella cookevillensis]|uniref:Uracil-DNA glycosylase n=1 Tax=Candidatus Berkiella cookevillensis TaxID=437022 RepID=A0A0Q9YAN7_9GAMM
MTHLATSKVGIPDEWASLIGAEFDKPYMKELRAFLRQEKNQRKYIYPKGSEIFSAFELTPPEKIKCVILGQDPYHGPGQAHGLCFSVKPGVAIPPSLLNIYKELQADLQIKPVKHGCLLSWAEQGVFLLNSVLTVEKGLAASHQGQGWEIFTDKVIEQLNLQPHPIAFVLWGAYAQKKGQVIDTQKHLVLKSVHPSPLSANRGFLGSRPFSKINDFLVKTGQTPINWQLPEQAEYI